tara:strand:- start:158 stop:520 length:363 start_codon:yes stop_codon:yes gene_type:complete
MAKGLHAFTVQESKNFDAYKDWNYFTVEMTDESANSVTTITSANPAKKVVIYNKPGSGSATFDATDIITLTINGETATAKKILIDATDLPFTLSGLLITSLSLTSSAGESGDHISVITFH